MRFTHRFTLISLLAFSLLGAARADETARAVFEIPVYAGTEIFPFRSLGESLLAPPFGTLTRVYKTSDGGALDAAKVTAFFDESLRAKGWTTDDPQAQPNFLVMRTQVYENPPDGTRIQVAGNFKVWVAPKDGMLTVWMQQWRISQTDQNTQTQVGAIVEKLRDFAGNQRPEDGFGEANSLSWEEDYTNEYLIERQQFSLTDSTVERKFDIGSQGIIFVSILIYRDAEIARQELKQRSRNWSSGAFDGIVIGKSLLIMQDRSFKQKEKIAALKTFLAELQTAD